MSPNRRTRLLFLVTLTIVLLILYKTSSSRPASPSSTRDFYSRTKSRLTPEGFPISSSLDKIAPARDAIASASDEDEQIARAMAGRLRDAEEVAKERANAKAPTRESVMGEGPPPTKAGTKPAERFNQDVEELSVGEPKMPGATPTQAAKDRNVAGRLKFPVENEAEQKKVAVQSEEDAAVEAELNSILKKSPIIIFSKSYCPHSRRAKTILLEKYSITPSPHVVELDHHSLGTALQARLADMTGRRTVPNVLVKGFSIGGGDDVAELDESGALEASLRKFAGKAILSVEKRAVDKSL